MDPAVDRELVVAGGLDHVDLVGIEDKADGGDKERRRDALPVEQVHHARQRDAGTVLSLRQGADGGVAVAKAQDGLVVDVEGQHDGDARAPGPRLGLEAAARPNRVNGLHDPLIGPEPAGFVIRTLRRNRLAGPHGQGRREQNAALVHPSIFHRAIPPACLPISADATRVPDTMSMTSTVPGSPPIPSTDTMA